MFVEALKSLGGNTDCRIVFVALLEHERRFGIQTLINMHVPNPAELVLINDVTEGQLCTVLAAREHFRKAEDILIMSSDSVVVSRICEDIADRSPDCAGLISTINAPGEQWSFAETDEAGFVTRVAEKKRISENASTGLYYFSNVDRFIEAADKMIAADERTRGEFYVIPVYQKFIDCGEKVRLSKASSLWDMGTPQAKSVYESYLSEQT